MGLKAKFLLIAILLLSLTSISNAAWEGPVDVIIGTWGNSMGQFGLRSDDSGYTFPLLNVITPDGNIVIADPVNKKQLVFSVQGNFIRDVLWSIKSREGGRTVYDVLDYSFGPVVGFSADGNIYTSSGGKYFLVSPTGQIIKTSTTRPLELGSANSIGIGAGKYRTKVIYPDITYNFVDDQPIEKYYRDASSNFYRIEIFTARSGADDVTAYRVHKYSKCSNKTGVLNIPLSTYEPMPESAANMPTWKPAPIMEYGEPLVAWNGDVYAWARTKTHYNILKWTWVDDTNVPTGPDAPSGLTITPSTSGLYLTWAASPQDPGCVTNYEISRATSAGVAGDTIATVTAGTLKYNDSTAAVGTTYYYKVRAKAGSEYSPYTAEMSGKK